MFAGGPVILSVLCWLQANAQVEVGGRAELRAGEMPTLVQTSGTPQYGSQNILFAAITPTLALSSRSSDNELRAGYSARFLWGVSDTAAQIRPLILQTLTLADVYRPSKRSTWHTDLRAIYGEEDSIALAQLLPGQATLPTSMNIFSVAGSADAAWRSTHLTTLSFQVAALHRQPLDNTTSGTNTFVLSTQTNVGATPELNYSLSRRSHLELSVPVSYYNSVTNTPSRRKLVAPSELVLASYYNSLANTSSLTPSSGPLDALVVQPQIAWIDELSRWHRLHLAVGVSYADIIRQPPLAAPYPSYPITPIVNTSLDSLLLRTRSVVLRSTLSAGVGWYMDPVLGTGVPRAPLAARIDATLGTYWNAGAYVNFTTDASRRPLAAVIPAGITVPQNGYPNERNGGFPDETVLSAGIPVRYTWPQLLSVEFAARYTVRAPHLRVPDQYFQWGETEIWATLTLSTLSRLPLGPS
jgi:hypothetical protein